MEAACVPRASLALPATSALMATWETVPRCAMTRNAATAMAYVTLRADVPASMSGAGRLARCARTATVASIARICATRRPLAMEMDCALATGAACARFRSRALTAMNAWMAISETTATSSAIRRPLAAAKVSVAEMASAFVPIFSEVRTAVSAST
eukprot:3145907-Rhodomonas_salina.1